MSGGPYRTGTAALAIAIACVAVACMQVRDTHDPSATRAGPTELLANVEDQNGDDPRMVQKTAYPAQLASTGVPTRSDGGDSAQSRKAAVAGSSAPAVADAGPVRKGSFPAHPRNANAAAKAEPGPLGAQVSPVPADPAAIDPEPIDPMPADGAPVVRADASGCTVEQEGCGTAAQGGDRAALPPLAAANASGGGRTGWHSRWIWTVIGTLAGLWYVVFAVGLALLWWSMRKGAPPDAGRRKKTPPLPSALAGQQRKTVVAPTIEEAVTDQGNRLPAPPAPGPTQADMMAEADAAMERQNQQRRQNDALALAGSLLSAGDPEAALQVVAPYAGQADPPARVLMAVGGIWWVLAEKTGSAEDYQRAADAFSQVLARQPSRQALRRRIGHCRLMQARASAGTSTSPLGPLTEAVDHLGATITAGQGDDARVFFEWGSALLERALITGDKEGSDLEWAETAFRSVLEIGEDGSDSEAAWSLQYVLRLRARRLQEGKAKAGRAEAARIIEEALEVVGDAKRRILWQASAIQAAVEEALAEKHTPASMRLRLREIQAAYRPLLKPGSPVPVVFAWVELLCAEGNDLMGTARKAKYAEAEAVLKLAGAPTNPRDELELQLLAARVMRLKSQSESTSVRLSLLLVAERTLQPHLDRPATDELKMEAAWIALAQAALLRPAAARLAARRAVQLTEALLDIPDLQADALRCHLQACLVPGVETRGSQTAVLIRRLIELAPQDFETWTIAARYALAHGDREQAVDCCSSARRTGAPEGTLAQLRREINQATASAVPAG